jgi:hypothetical protein
MTLTVPPTTEATTPPWRGIDHLALSLPDEDALIDLRQRLTGADCEVTDIIDHGGVRSVYFTDPNGIALEVSWWVLDATGRSADYGGMTGSSPTPTPSPPCKNSKPPATSPPSPAPASPDDTHPEHRPRGVRE